MMKMMMMPARNPLVAVLLSEQYLE